MTVPMKTLAKWTVADYHHMVEAGILANRRVELLSGDIVEVSPEQPIHYNLAKRGAKYLEELLLTKADVRFNGPITLSNSEPEPDIAIVQLPSSAYNERHPNPKDIFWLVEVANTSLNTDLKLKKALYAQAGIEEYWVINLKAKQLIVFRQPQGENYLSKQILMQGAIAPLAFPGVEVSVERLLS